MKRVVIALLLSFGLAAPAHAAMKLDEFLLKANALKGRGAMAIFSSDFRPLVSEMKTVGRELKLEGERRKAAGLPRRTCPPEGVKLSSADLLAMLNTIPPVERGISVKDGLVRVMMARFPCR